MKTTLFTLLAVACFTPAPLIAQENAPTAPPPARADVKPDARPDSKPESKPDAKIETKPGVYDFQDLPVASVLRDLMRDGKIKLIIGNNVQGNLTLHLEGKTPLQAVQSIAEIKDLIFEELDNVYYIMPLDEWRQKMRDRYFFEAPKLAPALAKFKKRYYDALIKEGFSKDEALKIITSETLPSRDMRFSN